MIPISRPSIGQKELDKVKEVFDSGWLGMGELVYEFENKIKKFLEVENVIAVNTGTSALHIALDAFGIKAGDEVIVPSLTFVASIQAIVACQARPVFCEIYADTLNIDTRDLERKITSKTRAIMPVHYGGQPCVIDEIVDIAAKNKIFVIEDAAHAFASKYKDKYIGHFSDASCFSFDPIKIITCGEGGAVVVKDKEIAKKIIYKRILGIDKDTWHRYKHRRSWFYQVTTEGFRYHLSNINAAIGLVQFKKIDKFIKKRRKIAQEYDRAFSNLAGISLLKRDYDEIAPFNYIIKIKKNREYLIRYLKDREIESGIHYIPNHLHPLFRSSSVSLPTTEKVWKQILSLPLYYEMTKSEVEKVINAVIQFFKK